MHEHLEHIMEHYNEALDELMDAQKYARCADKAIDTDEKAMYIALAKQELEHEERIVKSADKIASNAHDDMLHLVWKHLKKHVTEWRHSILAKMGDT
jgi:hypothetical protein